MELERLGAGNRLGMLGRNSLEHLHPLLDRPLKPLLFCVNAGANRFFLRAQLWVLGAHHLDDVAD